MRTLKLEFVVQGDALSGFADQVTRENNLSSPLPNPPKTRPFLPI